MSRAFYRNEGYKLHIHALLLVPQLLFLDRAKNGLVDLVLQTGRHGLTRRNSFGHRLYYNNYLGTSY